jgi:hypothetical protein
VNYAYSQDVVAMLAKLPSCPVKTQYPRLGDIHPTHDSFGALKVIKLEISEKALYLL